MLGNNIVLLSKKKAVVERQEAMYVESREGEEGGDVCSSLAWEYGDV